MLIKEKVMSKAKLFEKWNEVIRQAKGNELNFNYSNAICSEFKDETVTLDGSLGEKKYLVGQNIFNITNENGETLIHLAVRNKNLPLALYLITQGVDEKVLNKDGKKWFKISERDISKNSVTDRRLTKLLTTTRTKEQFVEDLEKARSAVPMIKKVGDCDTDIEFLNVCTACRKKLKNDELNTVRDIYKITDVNQEVGLDNETLLHAAILYKQNLFAKELIKRGANINALTSTGITPLMSAALANNVSLLKKLMVAGADVNAVAEDGNTALTVGAMNKNVEIVENLLKHPDINVKHSNNEGKKAVDLAVGSSENDRDIKTMLEAAETQATNNTRKRAASSTLETDSLASSISSVTMYTDQESMDSPIQQKSKQKLDDGILSGSSSLEKDAVLKAAKVLASFSSGNFQENSSTTQGSQESMIAPTQQTPLQKLARVPMPSELESSSPAPLPKLGRRK